MGALVTACFRNTNVLMVWAWVLWSAYALGTRTLLWFGHGCYSAGMLLEHERYYGLGMDASVTVCSWNTNVIMVWAWMLSSSSALQHECHCGLGMDARVTVCSWNTNVIMVWAWMLQRLYAPGTLTSEHERCMVWGIRCMVWGMDALANVCS